MEALAAFALAGNVLQFAAFASKIVTTATNLKRSRDGTLKEHSEIDTVIRSLEARLEPLKSCNDPALEDLVQQATITGEELQDALKKIRNTTKFAPNIRSALRAVWKQDTLASIEARLTRLTDGIVLYLQTSSRHILLEIQQDLSDIARDASDGLTQVEATQKKNFDKIAEMVMGLERGLENHNGNDISSRVDAIHATCEQILEASHVATQKSAHVQLPDNVVDPEAFVDTLRFREMVDREETIAQAHVRTFEWWLMETDQQQAPDGSASKHQQARADCTAKITQALRRAKLSDSDCSDVLPHQALKPDHGTLIQRWLRSGEGVFCIWGRPGSGKSTLMKAMFQNKRLHQQLMHFVGEWSQGYRLAVAKFFFYRPGTALQKSHLGLLQHLLEQVLTQHPDLCSVLFSDRDRRAALTRSHNSVGDETSVWSVVELKRAFSKLASIENLKVYLHIDGIDEMEGLPRETASIFSAICGGSNVKLLVAGRWTPEFGRAFNQSDSIQLHEITELDILKFVVDKLHEGQVCEKIASPLQFKALVLEVTSAAKGIFLWVRIVLDSLLHGLDHFENFDELFKRLQEYPRDLDNLYWFLLRNIDPRYRSDAAFWILMLFERGIPRRVIKRKANEQRARISNEQRMRLSMLELAEKLKCGSVESILETLDCYTDYSDSDFQQTQLKKLKQQIETRCLHIFNLVPRTAVDPKIEFAHRTIYDFIGQDEVLTHLHGMLATQVDVPSVYLLSRATQLLFSSVGHNSTMPEIFKELEEKSERASLGPTAAFCTAFVQMKYAPNSPLAKSLRSPRLNSYTRGATIETTQEHLLQRRSGSTLVSGLLLRLSLSIALPVHQIRLWYESIPQEALEPKAIIDIMLGVIIMHYGSPLELTISPAASFIHELISKPSHGWLSQVVMVRSLDIFGLKIIDLVSSAIADMSTLFDFKRAWKLSQNLEQLYNAAESLFDSSSPFLKIIPASDKQYLFKVWQSPMDRFRFLGEDLRWGEDGPRTQNYYLEFIHNFKAVIDAMTFWLEYRRLKQTDRHATNLDFSCPEKDSIFTAPSDAKGFIAQLDRAISVANEQLPLLTKFSFRLHWNSQETTFYRAFGGARYWVRFTDVVADLSKALSRLKNVLQTTPTWEVLNHEQAFGISHAT